MGYEYIAKTYGATFNIGDRVYHNEVKCAGTVMRVNKSCEHYVQVRFDGDRHASSCHPMALSRSETMTAPPASQSTARIT